ncbi:MAG: glycosyltransferase family 1 protein [Planctomycetales bacterium]|nr:glycosyltransferase family 1 protein [Planctomycetales bacterium]
MKILYDGDSLDNLGSGVGRYFRYLMHGLQHTHEVTLLDSAGRWDFVDRTIPRIATRPTFAKKIARKLGKAEQPLAGFGISHTTFFRKTVAVSCPEVVTVYDMVTECFPEFCRPWGSQQADEKAAAIERADACIAISAETARKMAILYPESAAKTTVIHLGSEHVDDWGFTKSESTRSAPYVAYVGGRVGYKNFRTLAEATGSKEWPANVTLKVAGGAFSRDEELMLKVIGNRDRIENVGHLSDSSLAGLYAGSLGVVFPSLDEGFGLPIVEAQRLRTVVLCSDIPIFHEIAGDGAIYFDPRNAESIASKISSLENSVNGRDQFLKVGIMNASRFSWACCINSTRNLYDTIVS